MVSKVIQASVLGASASVMAVAAVVLKRRKLSISSSPREPKLDQEVARERYMNSILCRGEQHCINQIRMKPTVFSKLCETLEENNLIRNTRNMSTREQVLMFLHLIGHNVRFRVIGGRFHRSIETVHRYFKIVLRGVLKLFKLVVKQPDGSTPPEIRFNDRFYPYFKDCIGALDGSHIRAKVSEELAERFRGRKGGTTQNILASITFDLKFTYVLAGWEGSAHDSRIIRNALEREGGLVIAEGKYYLGDAGYGIRNEIISPYRGVRYHLKEFSRDNPPQNAKELFNLRHSSLRTTIERGFGILKKRFRVLDSEPHWSYVVQVDIVLACCVIHNFIMGVDPSDIIINDQNCGVELRNEGLRGQLTQQQEREESREWTIKRDNIAREMWDDYVATI